mgnify:CR=1 FL=1
MRTLLYAIGPMIFDSLGIIVFAVLLALGADIVAEMERQAEALALALGVKGLMNIQFAVKDGEVYLIEVNPRASRTVPFVAKAIGQPVAKIAARVMAGEPLASFPPFRRDLPDMAVKEAVFPFARFPGVDPVLSPEMKSTGEVMGIDDDFAIAVIRQDAERARRLAVLDDPDFERSRLRLLQRDRHDAQPCHRPDQSRGAHLRARADAAWLVAKAPSLLTGRIDLRAAFRTLLFLPFPLASVHRKTARRYDPLSLP